MPAKSQSSPWTTVSLHPLASSLDTRSRPADIAPGAWRWKQNWAVTPDGKLCRRTGHEKWTPPSAAAEYTNFDYHRQGRTRTPVTFQFESTDNAGLRRYYLGTKSSLSTLDFNTGLYTDIVSGAGGDGCVWKAAELQNTVIFTNNKDNVLALTSGSTTASTINDLTSTLKVTAAKVVVQFSGFILLMNVVQDGERKMTRIIWSDLNLPTSFDPATTTTQNVPQFNPDGTPAPSVLETIASLAGFQDLDYGDEILAAAPLQGQLCILTRRAIWIVGVAPTSENVFTFNRVYYEPVNQTGCLAYENTLVSTGTELWYMGSDGIYNYNLYIPTPERQDWLYRASGLIYRKLDYQLASLHCQSPVGWYLPETRELWFSWAISRSPSDPMYGVNEYSFVAQIEQKTADLVDEGYTSFCSFRMSLGGTGGSPQTCYDAEFFLGASGTDWCIKQIGTAFKREYAALDASGDVTVDLPAIATYVAEGYTSILRTIIPLGFPDRDKIIRLVSVDHDTAWQADPKCYLRLRLGNNYTMVDPNDAEDICAPLWKDITPDKVLQCPDQTKLSEMRAKNLRPAIGTEWACLVQGRFLYVEISVTNPPVKQGATMYYPPAIGGDSCFQRIDFQALALPLR